MNESSPADQVSHFCPYCLMAISAKSVTTAVAKKKAVVKPLYCVLLNSRQKSGWVLLAWQADASPSRRRLSGVVISEKKLCLQIAHHTTVIPGSYSSRQFTSSSCTCINSLTQMPEDTHKSIPSTSSILPFIWSRYCIHHINRWDLQSSVVNVTNGLPLQRLFNLKCPTSLTTLGISYALGFAIYGNFVLTKLGKLWIRYCTVNQQCHDDSACASYFASKHGFKDLQVWFFLCSVHTGLCHTT